MAQPERPFTGTHRAKETYGHKIKTDTEKRIRDIETRKTWKELPEIAKH